MQSTAIVARCCPSPGGVSTAPPLSRSITCCQNTTAAAARPGTCGPGAVDEHSKCSEPRCIAPPQLDGHTRARLRFDAAGLTRQSDDVACREFAAIVEELRRPRTREEERREKRARLMVRQLPGGEHAEVTVSGTRRHLLAFHVWGHCHALVNVELGELRLQWKAHGLWGHMDQRVAIERVLTRWHAYLTGERIELAEAYACGWTMTGLEICADFTALRWSRDDVASFVGKFKRGTRDELRTKTGDGATAYTGVDGAVQTVSIGTRRSNVSWCLYDKTTQIEQAKDGANLPTYLSTWTRYGYPRAGELGCTAELEVRELAQPEVSRVELRLTARGLSFELELTPGAEPVELNLRDPAELGPAQVALAWAHATMKYRLVQRGTATRIERCKTDLRWLSVVDACGVELVEPGRQARTIAEDAHDEKVRRSARLASMALRRLGALHGILVEGPGGSGLLALLSDRYASRELDLQSYGRAYADLVAEQLGAEQLTAARGSLERALRGDLTDLAYYDA